MITGGALAGDSLIDPYTSTQTTFEIAEQSLVENAGENKVVVSKASPEVTFSKWNGESDFSVKYTDVQGEGSRPFFSDRIEWGSGSKEVHAYPLESSSGVGEDGGFEIEVVLNEVPESNVFSFEINGAEEYDFFYQPALTEEEITEGATRPDNVIGSYAVYHKTNKDHVIGGTNYATGKAYHIYRPKAIDANNVETWGDLNIENGILTVTIPTEYLSTATYPVKVDPTFGYTSAGASASFISTPTSGIVTVATSSQNGTISKLTFYGAYFSTQTSAKGLLYANSSSDPSTLISETTALLLTSAYPTQVWNDVSFSSPQSVSVSTDYWIGIANAGNAVSYAYDTLTSASRSKGSFPYATPSNPWLIASDTVENKVYSVYATYSANRRIIIGQ